MKSTYKPKKEQENRPTTKSNWFWQIFGGEFLLSAKVKQWIPFVGLLALLMAFLLLSEREIIKKNELIRKKEIEYKNEIRKLKQNNKFIPYEQNQELIQILEEMGFKRKDDAMYKIIIEN